MRLRKSITNATIVGGLSLLAIVWFVFWGVRDGMPGWAIFTAVIMIVFFATLTCLSYRSTKEQALAVRLIAEKGTHRRSGRVLEIDRLGLKETESFRETTLALKIDIADPSGQPDIVHLAVDIEDALLAQFARGARVHLLQDPVRKHRIALDRRYSPTHLR